MQKGKCVCKWGGETDFSPLHSNIPGPLFNFLGGKQCDPMILYTPET